MSLICVLNGRVVLYSKPFTRTPKYEGTSNRFPRSQGLVRFNVASMNLCFDSKLSQHLMPALGHVRILDSKNDTDQS